jgi:hypothetical protein
MTDSYLTTIFILTLTHPHLTLITSPTHQHPQEVAWSISVRILSE